MLAAAMLPRRYSTHAAMVQDVTAGAIIRVVTRGDHHRERDARMAVAVPMRAARSQ